MHRSFVLLGALLLAACAGVTPPAATDTSSPAASAPTLTPTRPPVGTPQVPTVPPATPPVVGEVPPEILNAVIDQAAELADVSAAEVEVVRAEQLTWPDGSLGCPVPGTEYTQEPVEGYWVELLVGDDLYDFRLSETGTPVLCPAGQGRPTSPGTVPDY